MTDILERLDGLSVCSGCGCGREACSTCPQNVVDDAMAEIRKLREALAFYARPIAYRGSNWRNDGLDRFTPAEAPYIQGVTRDGGKVACVALGLPCND